MAADESSYPDARRTRQPGPTILSISGREDDHLALQRIFDHSNWDFRSAWSLGEAFEFLRTNSVSVLICERDLPDGTWKNLLADLARCELAPVLVVSARSADEYLWAEVLNLGGCDVLAKPFDAREVTWAVSMAWNDWSRRAQQPQAALV